MRTTIKVLLFTLSLFLISNFALSQVLVFDSDFLPAGVYKTYKDYLNNNLIDYGSYTGYKSNLAGNKMRLLFDNNGEKKEIRIETADIWGYRNNQGDVYRINEKFLPCKIILKGKIVLYGDHTASGQTIVQTGNIQTGNTVTHASLFRFSFGTNGKMQLISKKVLREEFEKTKDELGLTLLKKVGTFGGYSLRDFIREYNSKSE